MDCEGLLTIEQCTLRGDNRSSSKNHALYSDRNLTIVKCDITITDTDVIVKGYDKSNYSTRELLFNREVDEKIKKLEDTIERLTDRLNYVENTLGFLPGGEKYHEAEEEFENLKSK